jgi:ribonuclease HII
MNAGVDEAGRGCFLGRVYAAAVIWDNSNTHTWLRDSKKLSEKQRDYMYDFIKYHAIDYGVGFAEVGEVDSLNILQATQLAMHRALNGLNLGIDHIYVDGNYFKIWNEVKFTCVIKGDSLYPSISAASILAKVDHDNYIHNLVDQNEILNLYDIRKNKGYGTLSHRNAIKKYGLSQFHRHSFNLLKYGKTSFSSC